MAESIQKLGGHPSAMPLLGLALILDLGPAVVMGFLFRFTGFFGSGVELRQALSVGLILVFVCQAIALLLGLVVLWQIEGLTRARHESIATAPEDARST